ncbi:alpha/beta fold hydrolase [Desulfopila inferna]|uniref:alpha/beta fold hydrolase n=1 Tax=Desulfopila inferna TaxID=468528 RepID=UPI001963B466|nr:alpha/beta fold hydrolase [Desulfopila inferna]MBM9603335.1 alpha/beta fold hydrolase [Desulfopila inferna]
METHTLKVDDINMHWEEAGEGNPVIFLHGIPTSPRLWRHVIPKISPARCLAWEMVGYGASISEGRGRDISVGRQADYLISWMQVLGLEKAVLVGHDLGGGVAQIAAVRHPRRVAGLVLMNAICYDSWPIPEVRIAKVAGSLMKQLPNSIFKSIFREFISMGHDRPSRVRESMHEHWPHYAAAGGAADFLHQVQSLDVHDTLSISDSLPRLNIPARIVWGAADRFQKIGYGYRLSHDLKCSLTRIEDGKHFVPEDHPEEVARTINELLNTEGI